MHQQSKHPPSNPERDNLNTSDSDGFHMKRRGTRSFHESESSRSSSQDLEAGGSNTVATSSAMYRARQRQQIFSTNSLPEYRRKHRKNVMLFALCILSVLGIFGFTQTSSLYDSGGISDVNFDSNGGPISQNNLNRLNAHLSKADADEILRWAHNQFPNRLVQLTSFGPSGMVVLHKLHELGILGDTPLVTIDTLHLFPETYQFIENVQKKYGTMMNLHTFRPSSFDTRDEFDEAFGPSLWKTNPDKYAYLSKVEPMERAMEDMRASALLTGRRKTQGGERKKLNVFEIDNLDSSRLKINPLVAWTYEDVWSYIRSNNIPYNPLHDRGYKSIGDEMTTIPVDPDADERSGRFVGLNKTECGLHSHLEKIKKMKEEAERDNLVFVAPKLECQHCIEVDTRNFDDMVLNGKADILLEFYSPFCGGCQEFAPKYSKIALALYSLRDKIAVARFDITENDIPQSGQDAGMMLETTPTLYLVQRKPSLKVTLYENRDEFAPVMEWLEAKTAYITPSAIQT